MRGRYALLQFLRQIGGMDKHLPLSLHQRYRRGFATLLRDQRGAALVEAAITLPVVLMVLLGIISYGSWFMSAHSVQQAANEGARASLPGLSDAERRQLASQGVARSVQNTSTIQSRAITTESVREGPYLTVTVTYAPAKPPWRVGPIVPAPDGPIRRSATVRLNAL